MFGPDSGPDSDSDIAARPRRVEKTAEPADIVRDSDPDIVRDSDSDISARPRLRRRADKPIEPAWQESWPAADSDSSSVVPETEFDDDTQYDPPPQDPATGTAAAQPEGPLAATAVPPPTGEGARPQGPPATAAPPPPEEGTQPEDPPQDEFHCKEAQGSDEWRWYFEQKEKREALTAEERSRGFFEKEPPQAEAWRVFSSKSDER